MKTALQQLIEFYNEREHIEGDVLCVLLKEKAQSLIEVERNQIADAFEKGKYFTSKSDNDGLDYYEENFIR